MLANCIMRLNSVIISACISCIVLSKSLPRRKYSLPFLTTRPESMNLLRSYIVVLSGSFSSLLSTLLVVPTPLMLFVTIMPNIVLSDVSPLPERSNDSKNQLVRAWAFSSLGLLTVLMTLFSALGMFQYII